MGVALGFLKRKEEVAGEDPNIRTLLSVAYIAKIIPERRAQASRPPGSTPAKTIK